MAKSFLEAWRDRGKIWEGIKNSMFKKEHVEQIADQRMKICEACPHIDKEGSKCFAPGTQPCCGLCGCKLTFKVRSLASSCDDKRWDAMLTGDQEDKLYNDIDYVPDPDERKS